MGFVYYGNYAAYFEAARVEALRNIGIVYRELEEKGIMLPVLDLNIKYKKPAHYDDKLTIEVIVPKLPDVKIRFDYVVRNELSNILVEGSTHLVFVKKENGKPIKAPDWILELLSSKFE